MNKTIMIVDDEPFFRTILRDILTEAGFVDILEAANGFEAVEKYSGHRPDLTIIDLYMPEKNGLETAKDIFAIEKKAKILICSGSVYGSDVQAAMDAGVSGLIEKPFIPEELIGAIKELLGMD